MLGILDAKKYALELPMAPPPTTTTSYRGFGLVEMPDESFRRKGWRKLVLNKRTITLSEHL